MDETKPITQPTQPHDGLSGGQLDELKNKSVQLAKSFAMRGTQTRKEESLGKPAYNWFENTGNYEGSTWQVSFWDYDDKSWQIQVTKVELKNDGRSIMTAYSIRADNSNSFPGLQVYKEMTDDRYHEGGPEDAVYLERVLQGLLSATENKT